MMYFFIKTLISAVIIAAVSALAKRNPLWGAILASVPLVTVLAMIWLYVDTKDPMEIAAFSQSVLWMILPSLTLFLSLPVLLKQQFNFYLALIIALGIMIGCYFVMIALLQKFGIKI